ncbi:MAG: FeoA family protein [Lachnospiraceae bacterium]|jgi:ferrous iron transport protein A
MIPLTFLRNGEKALVVRVSGSPEMKKHLEDLGFTAGAEVTGVSSTGGGNIIISLKDTRLAITSEMAAKVMVAQG